MPVMRLIRQLLVIFFLSFLQSGKEYRNNSFTVITHVLPAFQRCIQIYLLFILRREITMRKLMGIIHFFRFWCSRICSTLIKRTENIVTYLESRRNLLSTDVGNKCLCQPNQKLQAKENGSK